MDRPAPEGFPPDLAEGFEPLRRLGQGAMGEVWLARDRRLDRFVAIKLCLGVTDSEIRARFAREAVLLGRIKHPNVVPVLASGECEAGPYLVMEALEGVEIGKLPRLADCLPLMLEVAEGLTAVHQAGAIHRDLKPENIMVTREGRPVIVDFGLARDPAKTDLTQTGARVGTLAYMAPELLRGEAPRPAADWYAWGATLFQLIEERLPLTPAEAMAVMAGGPVPPLVLTRSDPRGATGRLLAACLAEDPAARPGSANAVRGMATSTRKLPRVPSAPPGKPRWPVALPALALALMAGALARRGASPEAPPPAPPASAPRPGPEPAAELASGWEDRIEQQKLPERLRGLVRQLSAARGSVGEDPVTLGHTMGEARSGRRIPGVDEVLRTALAGTPLREELDRERAALAYGLLDPGTPYPLRGRLHSALVPLDCVDALFEAFGATPPYRLRDLLTLLHPIRYEVAGPADWLPWSAPPAEIVSAGVYPVFGWKGREDRNSPVLFSGRESTSAERLLVATALGPGIKNYDWEGHSLIRAEVRLPRGLPPGIRRVELAFLVANVRLPNHVLVRWNGTAIAVQGPRLRALDREGWGSPLPDYRVRIGLPLDSLKAGTNRVEFSADAPPGTLAAFSPYLDQVELRLE